MLYRWLSFIVVEVGYWLGFIYIAELDAAPYILPVDGDDNGDHVEPTKALAEPVTVGDAPAADHRPVPAPSSTPKIIEPGDWEEVEYIPDPVNGGVVIHYRNGEKRTPPETDSEDPQTPPLLSRKGLKTPEIIEFDL